jgi:hypothetical protein
MTKGIVIKDAVQVGAEHTPFGADTPVPFTAGQGNEGLCTIQIQSFANVNLVPGNESFLEWLTKNRITMDGAGT